MMEVIPESTFENKLNYKKDFLEICLLGDFTTVFKSESKKDNKLYAIQKVCLNTEEIIEFNLLSKLKSEYTVQFYNSWIEPNYYIGSDNKEESKNKNIDSYLKSLPLLLHIQMELCPRTLRDAINAIVEKCILPKSNTLSLVGYYISSELFHEILECVKYLHSQNPAIIHSDIKPENILLTNFANNRFVKIANFGFATLHNSSNKTHTKYSTSTMAGANNYRAPELNVTKDFTTNIDLYSLGIILQELFQITSNFNEKNYASVLETKMLYLVNLLDKLTSFPNVEHRPHCEQVLSNIHLLLLSDEQLLNDNDFEIHLKASKAKSIEENFIDYYIQKKFEANVLIYSGLREHESCYYKTFGELNSLGKGGFSSVFKSQNKLNKKLCAIKKVSFEPKNEAKVTRELVFLSLLKSDFVVKYINSWIEPNYYLNYRVDKNLNSLLYEPHKSKLLHIQMELCSFTLRDAINIIKNECKTPNGNRLSIVGYYISTELLYELIECLEYLHTYTPPIIHRDLKPENILITNFVNNRFVKLSDFGLSTFQEFADQSHTKYKGTPGYRAPEVVFNNTYSLNVDIYSLGVIIQNLFQFDFNRGKKENFQRTEQIKKLALKSLNSTPDLRPICAKMLEKMKNYRLSYKELAEDEDAMKIISKMPKTSIEENFIEFFVQKKSELTKNNVHLKYSLFSCVRI